MTKVAVLQTMAKTNHAAGKGGHQLAPSTNVQQLNPYAWTMCLTIIWATARVTSYHRRCDRTGCPPSCYATARLHICATLQVSSTLCSQASLHSWASTRAISAALGTRVRCLAGGGWKHSDPEQSTCDASMLQQATLVKRANPNTRVFLYRNAEAAQQWQASSRALVHNASNSSLLLLRRPNGSIFCEPHNNNNYSDGCYYFWAFNNSRCQEAVIEQVYMAGIGTDMFDGYFLDDTPGLWCEHKDHSATLRMSAVDVSAVVAGTGEMIKALYPRLIARGKFAWQAFNNWPFQSRGGAPTAGSSLSKHRCVTALRAFAAMGAADAPFLWFLTLDRHHKPAQLHQDLAGFLLTRGQHAYIGTGWMDDSVPTFPSEYRADYGSPLAPMVEGPAGVFQRAWSGGTVKLDCNAFVASGIKSG